MANAVLNRNVLIGKNAFRISPTPNLRRGADMYNNSTYRLFLYSLKPPPGGLGVVSSKILMPFSLNCANLFIAE